MSKITHRAVALVLAAVTPSLLAAQGGSIAGRWEGTARVPGQGTFRIIISLDSAATGWQGSLLVPLQSPDPYQFVSVSRVQDSLILTLPPAVQNAVLRVTRSPDGIHLRGVAEANGAGTITAARAGTPEAAALVEGVMVTERSRAAANRLAESKTPAKPPTANPDSALLVTSDIALFWAALDRSSPDSLGAVLQREYLEKATVGVRDFIPGRIMSAEDLASYVRAHRATYDSVRAANLDVSRADEPIRVAFRKLKDIYPDAVFPDLYAKCVERK